MHTISLVCRCQTGNGRRYQPKYRHSPGQHITTSVKAERRRDAGSVNQIGRRPMNSPQ
jgi:hypothetical protein